MVKLVRMLLFLVFAVSCQLSAMSLDLYAEDKIVAVVNDDIITQKDLNDFLNFMRMQFAAEFKGKTLEEKVQSIKEDLLNKLIEDRLILQEANKKEIKVDDSRIRGRINELKKRYSTDADFERDLAKQGLVRADVENKIRDQLLMYYAIDLEVRSKVVVRPEEVTSFFQKDSKGFLSQEERELQIITLENEDLANSFAYNYRRGGNLEDLATRYPLTVNQIRAVVGGELRKDIEEAAFKLGMGEVSSPIKVESKYYVFKLFNIIPPKQLPLCEVQDKIYTYLFDTKMQEALTKWLDELKKNSYIQIK